MFTPRLHPLLRLAPLALAAACAGASGPSEGLVQEAHAEQALADVEGHWAEDVVRFLARHGVERRDERLVLVRADGDALRPVVRGGAQGEFRPDAPLSREELAALVVATRPDLEVAHDAACRTPERVAAALERAFDDAVAVSPWSRRAVCIAAEAGALAGRPQGTERPLLEPAEPVTRSELLAALRRIFEWRQPTFPGTDPSNALDIDCGELDGPRAFMYCDGIRDEVMGHTSSAGWDWALVHFALRHYVLVVDAAWATDFATDTVTRAEAAASLYVAFSHAFAFEQLRHLPPEPGAAMSSFDDDDGCIPQPVARRIFGADHHVGAVPDAGDRERGHDSLGNNLCP